MSQATTRVYALEESRIGSVQSAIGSLEEGLSRTERRLTTTTEAAMQQIIVPKMVWNTQGCPRGKEEPNMRRSTLTTAAVPLLIKAPAVVWDKGLKAEPFVERRAAATHVARHAGVPPAAKKNVADLIVARPVLEAPPKKRVAELPSRPQAAQKTRRRG